MPVPTCSYIPLRAACEIGIILSVTSLVCEGDFILNIFLRPLHLSNLLTRSPYQDTVLLPNAAHQQDTRKVRAAGLPLCCGGDGAAASVELVRHG